MNILCMGLMVCDILTKPVSEDLFLKDTAKVDTIRASSGGDAFNTAVNLSKMGNNVSLLGKVGVDIFGEFLLKIADESGIESSHIIKSMQESTAVSLVMVTETAQRHFIYHGGANDSFCLDDFNLALLKNFNILFVGSACALPALDGDPLLKILKYAKNTGVLTVVDMAGVSDAASAKIIIPLLQYIDIFIPSLDESFFLTGEDTVEKAALAIKEQSVGKVIIKMGSKGCYIHLGHDAFQIPAFNINPVDTTGTGDAFVAGFITGLIRGLSFKDCGSVANGAGALCALQLGAVGGIKSYEQLHKFAFCGDDISSAAEVVADG